MSEKCSTLCLGSTENSSFESTFWQNFKIEKLFTFSAPKILKDIRYRLWDSYSNDSFSLTENNAINYKNQKRNDDCIVAAGTNYRIWKYSSFETGEKLLFVNLISDMLVCCNIFYCVVLYVIEMSQFWTHN